MKLNLSLICLAGIAALATGCASTENQAVEKPITVMPTEVDATTKQATVTGFVGEIQNGKDGYTAQLTATDGAEFFVTISRANLKDPRTYRTVKTGEMLSVTGDHWEMDGKKQITVREIL